MKLAGERALVTGSSRGIGIDLVRELTRRGATVTVTGRDKTRTLAVADQLGSMAVVAGASMELCRHAGATW